MLKYIAFFSLLAASPAHADWWYVGHAPGQVVFVNERSIQRDEDKVDFWTRIARYDANGPAGETESLMHVDCGRQEIGWRLVAPFDVHDKQGDVSSRQTAEMARPEHDTIDYAQVAFVCNAGYRVLQHLFPIAIDELAFADALLKSGTDDPRALHDTMVKDPRVPIIRSSAPGTETFGKTQTVRRGQPLVPPRDYHKGPQVPRFADYDPDTTGIVYDVAYQGIEKGDLQFEIRGYSGDDFVHPGSGQTETSPLGVTSLNVNDLAFTIVHATPDALTYRVRIEKQKPVAADPCCEEPVAVEAKDMK